MWGLFISRPSSCRLWTGLGFHPHWFHWYTRIGLILGWVWCHYFLSLFRFLHLVSTASDTSKQKPGHSMRSCKLWCQTRAIHSPVSLATKVFASKLICYFSIHPAVIGLQSSTPPDNITLNPANRKANQSHLEFWTGISVAAYATLNMEQLISYIRSALVDTISSLHNSEGGVIPVSEVCELLINIYDILNNAMPKWVGNSAHILARFNSAPEQQCKVWASQFPFPHSLCDSISTLQKKKKKIKKGDVTVLAHTSNIFLTNSFGAQIQPKCRPLHNLQLDQSEQRLKLWG